MAASAELPPVPIILKSIRPYMAVAKELDARDPIVSYFCRRYAMEESVKVKDRSPEVTQFQFALMDHLEIKKKELVASSQPEVLSSDIVASAHIEEYALKLFGYADTEDRKAVFNKRVVKSFHTASVLFDVMQSFGPLTEEIAQARKYAKWKVVYIHGCLKKGETPIPGPAGGQEAEGAEGGASLPPPSSLQPGPPAPAPQQPGYPPAGAYPPGAYPPPTGGPAAAYPPTQPPSVNQLAPGVPPGQHAPPSTPDQGGGYQAGMPGPSASTSDACEVSPAVSDKAQKFCKFAVSALQYDDVPTAIENLEKALRLLQTGKE
ncbi:vacuolar protein sorting-associated protein VTA1 homolog isoform X1 [Lytechinus variegatus]|uniref:vacuolar protein sorting-associated protein VTA1 homolog isoform X1 n=1 Tax=Lytechinus variegatus TaxID=7654 RepID=UPI001BB2C268|nr:vacuolar protein sorting-associated protein VTA1 homolog isoform X1 [Lytechinus variegatus]